jgi:hypothetical protein
MSSIWWKASEADWGWSLLSLWKGLLSVSHHLTRGMQMTFYLELFRQCFQSSDQADVILSLLEYYDIVDQIFAVYVADKKVHWLNILFLIHGWCLVYSYSEDDAEYLQDQKWGGEDDVGDSSSLHLQLLCSMGSQLLHGCQALSNDLSAIKSAFHITDHFQRLGQALLASTQRYLWNLSEHLVLLAFADDDTELERKSKILDKLLDSFKIENLTLLFWCRQSWVIWWSTELAPFESGRCSQSGGGEVEKRRSLSVLLTLSSTL